jgi:hypothetical protein
MYLPLKLKAISNISNFYFTCFYFLFLAVLNSETGECYIRNVGEETKFQKGA